MCDFKCSFCDKSFSNKQACHKHEYILHKSTRQYSCKYCNKEEYSKASLKQHLASCKNALENGYEPDLYECELCDKTFKQKGNLDIHKERIHNIAKPDTRITRNKLRKEITTNIYEIKENKEIKSPKRFYIININTNETISFKQEYFCKAIAKLWCENLNIINSYYNIYIKNNLKNTSRNHIEKVYKIWPSFKKAIISLVIDRPKQNDIVTEIVKTIYV